MIRKNKEQQIFLDVHTVRLRKIALLCKKFASQSEHFGLCEHALVNIYNKIYAHNFYCGFDYVDSIEWTIIIVITIFFMPATSRTISITLLALAIVNNILLFSFCRKTDKYKDDSKFDKILLAFSTCLFCCAMIIVIWVK